MRPPSEKICLEDYIDGTLWLVAAGDLAFSKAPVIPRAGSEPQNIQGLISFRTLGFIKWFKTAVAVFREGEALKFAVAGKVFDLMRGNARAYKRTLFPCLMSFILEQNSKIAFRCVYWFEEWDDHWPENDIFSYVERATESEESKRASLETICSNLTTGQP